VRAIGEELVVEAPGCEPIAARPALAVPCRLEIGDEVLVVGTPDALFVVGVFGERRHALEADRIQIRARGAALRLTSEAGVHLAGRAVSFLAREALVTAALYVDEAVETLERRVVDRLALVARELDEMIEGSALSHALVLTLAVRDAYLVQGRVIRAG
jgi:hypothetical protein